MTDVPQPIKQQLARTLTEAAQHVRAPRLGAPATPLPPAPAPMPNGDLPEHRQKQWEAGNAAFQSVLTERDELERQLRELTLKLESANVQLEALKGVVNMMESTYLSSKLDLENRLQRSQEQAQQQVQRYQSERDHAADRAVSLEAVLANIYVIVRNAINETTRDAAA